MGVLSKLLGGGVDGIANAVDRFVETPDERSAAHLKEQALALKPMLAQIEVNREEARHASVFVAGARPATIWVCTVCMGGIAVAGVYGWLTGLDLSDLHILYGSTIAPVHLGLLGLRTFERARGVERNTVKPKP